MTPTASRLYYIHDPMCSWCWGFHNTWQQLVSLLPDNIQIEYVLGGLAADSNEDMPETMQHYLHQTWRNIQRAIPGTVFNFDFWTQCKPRRSTYPACRAVIAVKKQDASLEQACIDCIRQAYYLDAKNPSDDDILIDIAKQLRLDIELFRHDLNHADTQKQLLADINLSRDLGAEGFPSLVLLHKDKKHLIQLDYNNAGTMLRQIERCLAS